MRHKQYDFRTGFIDLLLCGFSTVVLLFILSTLLISPAKVVKEEGVKKNAEYIVTMEWDPESTCDVDLWAQNPNGNIVSFKAKDVDLFNIERDDMGTRNDTVTNVDGEKTIIHKNEEFLTIRGIIPGRYTINAHLYSCTLEGDIAKSEEVGTIKNLKITFKVIKLNPNFLVMAERQIVLEKIFQEKTAINFTLAPNGLMRDIDDTPKRLIKIEGGGNQ